MNSAARTFLTRVIIATIAAVSVLPVQNQTVAQETPSTQVSTDTPHGVLKAFCQGIAGMDVGLADLTDIHDRPMGIQEGRKALPVAAYVCLVMRSVEAAKLQTAIEANFGSPATQRWIDAMLAATNAEIDRATLQRGDDGVSATLIGKTWQVNLLLSKGRWRVALDSFVNGSVLTFQPNFESRTQAIAIVTADITAKKLTTIAAVNEALDKIFELHTVISDILPARAVP